MKDLLPIGSVVLLEGGNKKVSVIGYCQVDLKNQKKVYDYAGVTYPEGYLTPDNIYMFDQKNIVTVVSFGFKDEEGIEFIKKIENLRNEINSGLPVDKAIENFAKNYTQNNNNVQS